MPTWSTFESPAARCRACGCWKTSNVHALAGDGPPDAAIALIGEAPGANEEEQELNFIGRAGEILDGALLEAGIYRAEVWVENSAKCRPVKILDGIRRNRNPTLHEIDACRGYLVDSLRRVRPRVIVCLGNVPSTAVIGRELGGITANRGKVTWSEEFNAWVIQTVHPAYVIRRYSERHWLVQDLKLAKRVLENNGPVIGAPTEIEVIRTIPDLYRMRDTLRVAGRFHFDWESNGVHLTESRGFCLSLAYQEGHAFVVPRLLSGWIYAWGRQDAREVDHVLTELFTSDLVKGGFHVAFDNCITRSTLGVWPTNVTFCGMMASHLLDNHLGLRAHSLKLRCDELTDMGRYDDPLDQWLIANGHTADGKPDMGKVWLAPDDLVHRYNACLSYDSLVQLSDGTWDKIGEIVRRREPASVRSLDIATGHFTTRRVTGWYKNANRSRDWRQIVFRHQRRSRWGVQAAVFTPDHRILTDRGWVEVQQLKAGDRVACGEPAMSPTEREVVIGTLLGDGSLARRSTAALVVSHSEKQLDYIRFKSDLLARLNPKWRRIRAGGFKGSRPQVRFETDWTVALAELGELFYPDGKKIVPPQLLSEMSPLGLAIWYMDDGTLAHRGGSMSARIATHSYSRADVYLLSAWLKERYDVNSTVDSLCNGRWHMLRLRADATRRFAAIIAPHVHPSMSYKLPVEFRGLFNQKFPVAQESPHFSEVAGVVRWDRRGNRSRRVTSYCIDVAGTHNFITTSGVAHNCDSDGSLRLERIFTERLHRENLWDLFVKERMPIALEHQVIDREGVRIDVPYLDQLSVQLGDAIEDLETQLDAIARSARA